MAYQHPIKKQLERDHYHMYRLLHCVSECLETLGYEDPACQRLVADGLEYIQGYPAQWHHPVEDKLFALLASRCDNSQAMLSQVAREHIELDAQTQALTKLVQEKGSTKSIKASLLAFINLQIKHIDRENQLLYPLLDLYLQSSDWQALEIAWEDKPLYGAKGWRDYQRLLARAEGLANAIRQTQMPLAS